eukprot:11168637-Lingulodinium_polyedra.AAC.1
MRLPGGTLARCRETGYDSVWSQREMPTGKPCGNLNLPKEGLHAGKCQRLKGHRNLPRPSAVEACTCPRGHRL